MIWNGGTGSPRAGKASAKLIFDNSDRKLNLDFDEVSIERAVHRDGVNLPAEDRGFEARVVLGRRNLARAPHRARTPLAAPAVRGDQIYILDVDAYPREALLQEVLAIAVVVLEARESFELPVERDLTIDEDAHGGVMPRVEPEDDHRRPSPST